MSKHDETKIFKCTFADDDHFYTSPVPLTCSHHVCKECIVYQLMDFCIKDAKYVKNETKSILDLLIHRKKSMIQ